MFVRLQPAWFTCFEGDNTPPAGGDKPQTFTQDDVNKMIAAERRKLQAKNDEMAQQLSKLGETANMTTEERDALKQQIDALQTEHLSKEEKARRESDKLKKTYDEQLSGVTGERDQWKRLHSDAVITNAIIGSATREKTRAFHPQDIIAHLQPLTATAPVEEDGKVVRYEPRVKFPDLGKDGKPVTMDFTVDEAVARMTELDRYKHLFVSTAKGGAGAHGSEGGTKGGKVDLVALSKDPVAYEKWAKENIG